MTKNFLKFWGTRGSCSVSGIRYSRFGGNTCCLEVRYGDTLLILDAGTGIRPLGEEMLKNNRMKIDLFLGHSHWDHIIGFPFFEPIYRTGTQITIWSPAGSGKTCREIFSNLLASEYFPVRLEQVQANLEFRTTQQKTPIKFDSLTIDFHTTQHPGLTFCFKIKTPHQTISYVTDNEMLLGYHGLLTDVTPALLEPHEGLINFLKGTDILIHEAQYFPEEYLLKSGWGHSSARNALALIKHARPKQWFVTHHDPLHTDEDLKRLGELIRKELHDNKLECPVELISDEHVIQLK